MADLPSKIMVWESSPDLRHIGTWATTRYPVDAVAYVPEADAAAAQALIARLRAYLDALPDGTVGAEVIDAICGIAHGRTDLAPDAGTAELAKLRDELHLMKTAGIIEVMVRNPSVADYVQHWEGRTLKSEASLAAQTALVETLTGALRNRDGGSHDDDCKAKRYAMSSGLCNCGHDDACAVLEAAEIATMTPEQRALYRASMDMRAVAKGIADGQIAARDSGEG